MEKKRILIVDDDAVARRLMKVALKKKISVLGTSHSDATHQLEKPLDLAVIDHSPPHCDAFRLFKSIKRMKPDMPVVLMTAYGNEALAIKALRAGLTDYIKKPVSLAYLTARLSEIFGNEKNDGLPELLESSDEFIMDGMAAYIEENYHMEEINLESLAKIAGMNKYKFCRLFKEKHGCGLTTYLNNVRIRNGLELLQNKDLNITEIALSVGYDSTVHFERVFKGIHGVSPREYRRNIDL